MRIELIARRYFLVLFWLLFACFTAVAATEPGYVLHPERVPYPWLGVVVMWVLLGIIV